MLLNINNKINISLCGMMGSGKSAIGKILANKLDYNFIDVDKMIEIDAGKTINKIFVEDGEEYFRDLEEKITLKLLKNNKNIISLGGGGFINKNIRKEILKNHISFWLSWNNSTIIKRILKSKKRPIAFNSTENNLKKLINERSNFYAEANFKVNCETLTKNMIVKNIIKLYEKN